MAKPNFKLVKSSLPSPEDVLEAKLPNGITVLARSNFNSPSVSFGGYLPAGAIFESDEKLGLADFVAASLMRGTQRRTFDEIYNELESVGASMGFDSGVHNTNFGGRALVEDLPLLLQLLAESLQTPVFPADEIERLRTQLLTGLALRAQDTADMADLIFEQMLYENHPYGRPTDGFVETIQSITRSEMEEFHRLHFGPRGLVIAIVGAIHPKKAVEEVERYLGGWQVPGQKEAPPLPPLKPVRRTKKRHHPIKGKSQSDIIVGVVGPRRKSPDYMAASLGNSVLGQFGMMGRIGGVVREKSGLAYYAYSSLHAGTGPGSWEVAAGVNPSNVGKALGLIEKELRRFVKSGVTKEELADSQANYIGRLPLSLESNNGMVSAILNIHRYDLGMDYYQRYESLVRSVTRDDVLETARKYIDPERLVIAVAGP
ncbi:MAG: insulinase family protein [Chloroflexi bacterium]|nr:insulinase family protein [Chloroflexota bacterium]MDL1944978.1 insulinase family protein [Chloroflexi bacterium CFX2]